MLLGALIALGGGLQHLQTLARTAGRKDFVDTAISRIAAPLSMPLSNLCDGTHDFFVGMLNARRLTAENRALKDQLAAEDLYEERVDLLEERIEELQKLNSVPISPGRKRVALSVIYFAQNEGLITLSGGTELGVAPNMPVVNGQGLVALVQTVSRSESQAALITSFNLKFGGVDGSRKPPEYGLISGRGAPTLTMTMFNPSSPIASGDQIVTSGLSSRLPYGIPIGRVISVAEDPDYGTRQATIDPAFNLGTVGEVQVLE